MFIIVKSIALLKVVRCQLTVNAGGFVHFTMLPRDRVNNDNPGRYGLLFMPWEIFRSNVTIEILSDLLTHFTLPGTMEAIVEDEEEDDNHNH
jgi:hypothetical protein